MLEHWKGRCAYCGVELKHPVCEHIVYFGHTLCPGHVPWNVVPSCRSCNASKNDTEVSIWLEWKFGPFEGARILCELEAYRELARSWRPDSALETWLPIEINTDGVTLVQGDSARVIRRAHGAQEWRWYSTREKPVYWPTWHTWDKTNAL